MTEEGYEALKTELEELKGPARREVAEELEIARSHGDLRENADYDAAKEKQGMLEARIRMIADQLGRADVVDISRLTTDQVRFGLVIDVENMNTERQHTYRIVGEFEADLEKGKLSITAPLIQAFLGQSVGDFVDFETMDGLVEYEIMDIRRP
jgi:transcription elongation factor GreA